MSNLQDIASMPDVAGPSDQNDAAIKVKAPKRILHFSDGTMEEFSDDEDEDITDSKNYERQVSVVHATWGPWMIHKAMQTGNTMLAACDYIGESIAAFLGITTPKYRYEIELCKRMQEEKAKAEKEEKEVGGWMEDVRSGAEQNDIGMNCITSENNTKKF